MKKKSKNTGKAVKPYSHDSECTSLGPVSVVKSAAAQIACLIFFILLIYSHTLNAPFQWDEDSFIIKNQIIKNLHYFVSPSDASGLDFYGHFITRYIAYLTFAINYSIHGFSVTGYHIVNIAIHIANAVLVYFLVLLTFRTPFMKTVQQKAKYIAFFSAVIFAVHPIQTEAVTYIMQRFASLVAFFYLLSLVAYIKFRLMAEDKKALPFVLIVTLALSFISAVLAMKTKENAFTLPFVVTLYEFCFFGSPFLSVSASPPPRISLSLRLLYLAPILLTLLIIPITAISLAGTVYINPRLVDRSYVMLLPRWTYFFTQFRVIVTYLRLFFLPVNQNLLHDYPIYNSLFDTPVLLSFMFLLPLFGTGIYLLQKTKTEIKRPSTLCPLPLCFLRLMGFGILWFFITLSVESSIIPIPMIMCEYRIYIPSVGVIICAVSGAFLLKEKLFPSKAANIIVIMLILWIVILSAATYLRNELWTDKIKLWEDTAQKSPRNAFVHYNLGCHYQERDLPDKAIEQYLIATQVNPYDREAHNNLGILYCLQKRLQECSYEISATYAIDYYNRGLSYAEHGFFEEAIQEFQHTINLYPGLAKAHFGLGLVYYKTGQFTNARRELITGLNVKPDDQDAQQLLQKIPR